MREALRTQWFLVGLILLIPAGLLYGVYGPTTSAESSGLVARVIASLPRTVTALVLFLMAFSLDSRAIAAAVRSPGPVLWAAGVNYTVIPALALGVASFQLIDDFRIGLLIAACVPCTMAAASVWTRKAGGNDAVSLMVTLLTNGLCFAVTPLLLELTTGKRIELDPTTMVMRLVISVLVPMACGQLLRLFSRPRDFAIRRKTPIGVVAQSLILVLVLLASVKAGESLQQSSTGLSLAAVGLVWGSCIALHLVAMAVGWWGAGCFQFHSADRIAVVFASSQKTLPIGVLIATDPAMFGAPDLLGEGVGIPFAVFPMLMFHASQLFVDTWIAGRLSNFGTTTNDVRVEESVG